MTTNLAAADLMLTTSVTEGFGMAFLESWLAERTLVGRDLPEITTDFVASGLQLDLMYRKLRIPVDVIGRAAFHDLLQTSYAAVLDVVPPTGTASEELVRMTAERTAEDMVDFADLDEHLQEQVLRPCRQIRGFARSYCVMNPCVRRALATPRPDSRTVIMQNKCVACQRVLTRGQRGTSLADLSEAFGQSALAMRVSGLCDTAGASWKIFWLLIVFASYEGRYMRSSIGTIIRKHSQKREPRPTGWQPVLAQLPGIKAVLFDVYGTLFVSSATRMQPTDRRRRPRLFPRPWRRLDRTRSLYGRRSGSHVWRPSFAAPTQGHVEQAMTIRKSTSETSGTLTLRSLENDGLLDPCRACDAEQICRLAVEFEWRTNPVWPMPHAAWCLRHLEGRWHPDRG